MKATDSINHQTSTPDYDQSIIVSMGVEGYYFKIVTPDQKVGKKLSNKSQSGMAVLENTSETKLHPNIKVAQISAESISGNLGVMVGLYQTASAITEVTFTAATNFAANTILTIYGILKA